VTKYGTVNGGNSILIKFQHVLVNHSPYQVMVLFVQPQALAQAMKKKKWTGPQCGFERNNYTYFNLDSSILRILSGVPQTSFLGDCGSLSLSCTPTGNFPQTAISLQRFNTINIPAGVSWYASSIFPQ